MSSIIGRMALGLPSKTRHQTNKAPKKKILVPVIEDEEITEAPVEAPSEPEQAQPVPDAPAPKPAPARSHHKVHHKAAHKPAHHKAAHVTHKKRSHHKKSK